jgi:hypothetical protein
MPSAIKKTACVVTGNRLDHTGQLPNNTHCTPIALQDYFGLSKNASTDDVTLPSSLAIIS